MEQVIMQLVERAIVQGAQQADAIAVVHAGISVGVYGGEVESFTRSLSRGAGLRVIVGGRVGFAYTEQLDAVDDTVRAALQSAEVTDVQQGAGIYEGPGNTAMAQLKQLDDGQDVQRAALELYDALKEAGAVNTQGCEAESNTSTLYFCNSAGVQGAYAMKSAALLAQPVAKIGNFTDSGFWFDVKESIGQTDVRHTAQEAMRRARQYHGATGAQTGQMPVVLLGEAMADLLEAFSPAFSAVLAEKGLSLFKDREGQQVASACVTLIDSPQHPQLPFYYPFDGEGVPTSTKKIVDQGILTTLLYDVASANRKGVKPTGNARRGYSSSIAPGPYHFYIAPGNQDRENLMQQAQHGVIISEVSGLHAGVNATSGDFSLLSKGFVLKDGVQGAPIEQMVVSGNFFDLLKHIEAVGNDLLFGVPGGSCFGSPTLYIASLSIAAGEGA